MKLRALLTLGLLMFILNAYTQELPKKLAIVPIDLIELLGEFNDEDVEDLEASMRNLESNQNTTNQKQSNHSTMENSKKGAK